MDRRTDALDLGLARLDPGFDGSVAERAGLNYRRRQPALGVADGIQCAVKREPSWKRASGRIRKR